MSANLALASMMVVLLFAVHLALGTFNPVLGSKPLALAIERNYKPGDIIVSMASIRGRRAYCSTPARSDAYA